MGQFRFVVPEEQLSQLQMWQSAYICGIEGVPWEGRVSLENGILTVDRSVDDSGRLYIPFATGAAGPATTMSTCSLRQTGTVRTTSGGNSAHILPLELARGECFRLRNQADMWRRAGLQLDQTQLARLDQSTDAFLRAACARGSLEQVSAAATDSIYQLVAAGEMLADCYNRQALAYRKQNERQLATLVGASASPQALQEVIAGGPQADLYRRAFNTVGIPIGWGDLETSSGRVDFSAFDSQFEWAANNGMRVIAGPLLNFQPKQVPEWLYLYDGDFQSLVESVEGLVERTVRKYMGRVNLWHATAGLNTAGPIALDEEQVMRLAVAVIHTIRRIDQRTPVLISVDQPWGEYLGAERDGISPLHFADALIRSNLGVSGIGLELRMNYASAGSLPRSLLDFGQQIDRWATLGLPLLVQMSIPAATGPDPQAIRACDVIPLGPKGTTTAEMQARMAMRWIQTMLAKGVVHGVLWEGWDDRKPHPLPHCGLIDNEGKPRPLLESLCKLRQELLA